MASAYKCRLFFLCLSCVERSILLVVLIVVSSEATSRHVYVSVPASSVDENANTDFHCLLYNGSPAKVKRWEFNGKLLVAGSHISITPANTKHKLKIILARVSDSGTYTCIAQINGAEVSNSEALTVYPALVTDDMPVTTARVGDDVTLKCTGPRYHHISWWRNDVEIQPGKQGFLRFRSTGRGSRLHIADITKADNGTYRCLVTSKRSAYRTAELLVKDAIYPSTQSVLMLTTLTTGISSSTASDRPTTRHMTTQTARSTKFHVYISSDNGVSGTASITNKASTRYGSMTTASLVGQSTASSLSARNKTTTESTQSIGVKTNITAKPVAQGTNTHGETGTLQHFEHESVCVPAARQMSVHLYDVMRLYENMGRERQEGSGARRDGSTVGPSASIERDSGGYVVMKQCEKQAENERIPNNLERSDLGTAGYMEMKRRKSETKTSDSVIEEVKAHQSRPQVEDSRYVNMSAGRAGNRKQISTKS